MDIMDKLISLIDNSETRVLDHTVVTLQSVQQLC